MVSAIDKTWDTKEKTYQDRHRRTMFEVSADEDKQTGFYQRLTNADLYRVSVLTIRMIKGKKIVLGRTCTIKGPLPERSTMAAAIHVARQTMFRLHKYAKQYSKPFCGVCLGPVRDSTRVVQTAMDSWFTHAETCDHDRGRIWIVFMVCSDQCGKEAADLITKT